MDRVWENVLDVVEEKIGKTNTETWLKPTQPIGLRGDTFHLEVPSPLFREWLLNNLIGPLEASLASVLGQTAKVAIHVGSKQQGELFPSGAHDEATANNGADEKAHRKLKTLANNSPLERTDPEPKAKPRTPKEKRPSPELYVFEFCGWRRQSVCPCCRPGGH